MNIDIVQIVLIDTAIGLPVICIWIIVSLIAASKNVIATVECVEAPVSDCGIERHAGGGVDKAISPGGSINPVGVRGCDGHNVTLDLKSTGIAVKSKAGPDNVRELRPGRDSSL